MVSCRRFGYLSKKWVDMSGNPFDKVLESSFRPYIDGDDLATKVERFIKIKLPARIDDIILLPHHQLLSNVNIIFSDFDIRMMTVGSDKGRYMLQDTLILLGKVIEALDLPILNG
jgi:hypothetical protein